MPAWHLRTRMAASEWRRSACGAGGVDTADAEGHMIAWQRWS